MNGFAFSIGSLVLLIIFILIAVIFFRSRLNAVQDDVNNQIGIQTGLLSGLQGDLSSLQGLLITDSRDISNLNDAWSTCKAGVINLTNYNNSH
jgi:tellurite resistance protein TehA-like permease